MRKILFIINPAAGQGQSKEMLPIIKNMLKPYEIDYDIKVSSRKNQITEMVITSLKENTYSDVVAIGGDGTVVETINGILGQDIKFGLIPMGTGNDLARTLNIPCDSQKALEKIIYGKVKTIDLGSVNGTIFVNSAGVGIDGAIINDTDVIKNYISGSAAYLLSTIKSIVTFKPFRVEMLMDGVKFERDAYLIAIGNGQYFGGGMKITPSAELDSGSFQVCLVRKLSRMKFLRIFPSVYKGKHSKAPEVEMFSCKEVVIKSPDRELLVSADGNIVTQTPAKIEIINEKLKIWT